jgi:hypothetical protein
VCMFVTDHGVSYINQEQEHARTMESSVVDERTQHEIYAYPFLKSVMAGVASVMCSYSRLELCLLYFCSYVMFLDLVDGYYACEHDGILNHMLRRELGFQGCRSISYLLHHFVPYMSLDVQSDWQATHSTLSALYGLDMTMPGDVCTLLS